MHPRRGTLLEVQVIMAGYGILVAVLFPRFYPHQPLGLAFLWLVGLMLARLYSNMLCEPPPSWHVLLVYAALTMVPALSIYGGFPPGALFVVVQPYLTMRILLKVNPPPP